MARAQNIGIKAIELYIPNQCVEQSELEKFDGVSAGKYTVGLGQTKMSFCDDREDIYSLALTAVSSLLRKYKIDPTTIGRLEVGTETILDKSKSVKSVLMQLFQPSGNTNIEGVDTNHACYGGTNALFNTVNWIESSAWDGRNAIVVMGDIALYKKGNARPTGGAGCVALLVGPDAPIVLEPGLRGTYVVHAYDFYKADLTSEYPIVDGHFSLQCYSEALDACYKAYNAREKTLRKTLKRPHSDDGLHASNGIHGNSHAVNGANGVHDTIKNGGLDTDHLEGLPVDRFDYMCFHSPTCKKVEKSYARLLYNDFLVDPNNPAFVNVPEDIRKADYKSSLTDKDLEKFFVSLAKKRIEARVRPTLELPTMCGNMYCASLFSGFCSLLSNVTSENLQGKRVALFSYGSGLASSMFSLTIRGNTDEIAKTLDLHNRLAARNVVAPQVYDEMCNLRERAHLKKGYKPSGSVDNMAKDTYYLTEVDDMFRRSYEIKS